MSGPWIRDVTGDLVNLAHVESITVACDLHNGASVRAWPNQERDGLNWLLYQGENKAAADRWLNALANNLDTIAINDDQPKDPDPVKVFKDMFGRVMRNGIRTHVGGRNYPDWSLGQITFSPLHDVGQPPGREKQHLRLQAVGLEVHLHDDSRLEYTEGSEAAMFSLAVSIGVDPGAYR